MRRLVSADIARLFKTKWLYLCAIGMMALSAAFCAIQRTAMDYEVAIDRVLFLPMSFYGVAVAALVSQFVGADFSDGVIKNKVLSGAARSAVYRSNLAAGCLGCAIVYLLTLLVTGTLGALLFECNITLYKAAGYAVLGLLTALAYACLFTMICMLAGNRSLGTVITMALSFALLILSLHTNQVLVQEPYVDGVANPAYASGFKRIVYAWAHDLNPTGQTAQLSMMRCLSPLRYIAADALWAGLSLLGGAALFERMDIR